MAKTQAVRTVDPTLVWTFLKANTT